MSENLDTKFVAEETRRGPQVIQSPSLNDLPFSVHHDPILLSEFLIHAGCNPDKIHELSIHLYNSRRPKLLGYVPHRYHKMIFMSFRPYQMTLDSLANFHNIYPQSEPRIPQEEWEEYRRKYRTFIPTIRGIYTQDLIAELRSSKVRPEETGPFIEEYLSIRTALTFAHEVRHTQDLPTLLSRLNWGEALYIAFFQQYPLTVNNYLESYAENAEHDLLRRTPEFHTIFDIRLKSHY